MFETEGRGKIGFEERFEDFVSEENHAEGSETEVGLVRLYVGRWTVLSVCSFRSREEGVAILKRVRHKAANSAQVRVANLKPEDELERLGSGNLPHSTGRSTHQ
jgi:hypothetical protein